MLSALEVVQLRWIVNDLIRESELQLLQNRAGLRASHDARLWHVVTNLLASWSRRILLGSKVGFFQC